MDLCECYTKLVINTQGIPYIYKQFYLPRNTSDMSQYGQKKPAYSKLTVVINDSNSSLAIPNSLTFQLTNSTE